jgi:predicted metal-dependent peptidase
VPAAARREVRNRLRRRLDYQAGLRAALALYPWHAERVKRRNAKRRRQYDEALISFDPEAP